ncbi:Hypothetical protein PHPALM_860 [Phytophthora palmivora]|uniref:Transmembrane protein n=1 Tax=Phytophthora palmivora TaxID=4796 RepID=A0A2P4YTX6_9STRA|nr:Hypothetical protein PHPALM_860 [Phytophthora palmivora]
MCILVGIPTVLIDTQTRIILLGTNSTQTAIVGALGMSIMEIILRAGKAALVIMEIRRRKAGQKRTAASTLQQRTILEMFVRNSRITSVPESRMKPRQSLSTGLNDFELWRRQMQAFHTAELNADMYAEYISIGCSTSILFFYGSHPHYSLLRQTVSPDAPEVDMVAWRVGQLSMLVVQIGIEVIVDYVSIVFEIVIGIEFDHVKNLGSFLAALFMVAAVMNITISIGNPFLGKLSRDQSRDELIVANSVWAAFAFCTVILVSFLPLMLSLRFLDAPNQAPTMWYCFKRLVRATFLYFAVAVVAVITFGYLVTYLVHLEPTIFKYKIDNYADNLSLLIYFAGIIREIKKIFYEETSQGRERLHMKRKSSRKRSAVSSKVRTVIAPQPSAATLIQYHTPTFWQSYIKQLPTSAPPIIATAFVHILSQQRIVERGSTAMTIFFIGGIALKLGIQELAKHYIVKKRVRSTRIMCVLVGVPTVLIDTQARVILIGSSNTQTAFLGVLGMALLEISFRVAKTKFVQWTIYQREVMLTRENEVVQCTVSPTRPSLSSTHLEFEMWRRQVQSFHTAELNADMYAEYIAIGCSASILFFFGNHPRYSMLRQSYTTSAIVDLSAWRLNQMYMLGFQLGVEVAVDYISIVLEMASGLEFDHIQNLSSFLAVLFMVTAVMNITISAGKVSHDQMLSDLIVANSVWAMVTFCSIIFLARLHSMLSLRFLSAPNYRPTTWFCFKKLFRRTTLYFVAVLSFTCGFSRLLAYVSSELPEILVYKFECYIDNFSLLAFFTAIAITTKEIFYRETCQGRDRLLKTARIKNPATVLIDPKNSVSMASSLRYRTPKFWYEYVKNLPKGAPPIVATAFVHVLSRQKVVNHGSVALYCFVMGSILCKLAIQEGAKHYVLNKHIRSIRVMCVLVGVPTVLIDTQTRIILLGSNSTKIAVVGALVMAFVEICFRVGKAMLVVLSIRRRERKVHPQAPISICSKNNDSDKRRGSRQSSSFLLSMVELSSVVTSEDFELWRRQVQAFHTAELNADMYAEYIAIGCSASILFFYGDHPHYSLLRETKRTEAKADVTVWYTNQMYMLAFQVAVEILVDYVSFVLEMKIGIEFENIQRLGAFLAVLFMVAAVMNINISIGVYLS